MEPWKTDQWWVSPWDFAEEAGNPPGALRAPILHDVTLRDGEECAYLVFNHEDRLAIARALDEIGITRFEVGVTVPGSEESLRELLRMGLRATIYAAGSLGRSENMERALRAGVRHITLGMHVSDAIIEKVLRKSRREVLDSTLRAIRTARKHDIHVNLFMADAPRADSAFLRRTLQEAEEVGIGAVTVVDTFASCHPGALAYLVEQVSGWTKLPVEVHAHNDYGLAVANALAAWQAGARVIHTTVNGLGYRCGNPPTEEVALAVHALYGLDTGIRLDRLCDLSKLVQGRSGLSVAFNKPVVGEGAFAYEKCGQLKVAEEAGVHQAYYPYLPEAVGQSRRMILSKWSDLAMLALKLEKLGLSLHAEQVQAILARVKEQAIRNKRAITEDELRSIVRAVREESCPD